MAMAAGIATLEVYKDQKLFENAAAIAPHFEEAIHSLKGLPNVVDIRNIGLMGAVEMSAIPGYPTKRAMDVFDRMWKKGVVVRSAGPTIAFSPPLICEKSHIDEIFGKFADAIVESSNYF
jgi:beta-alanine--pyruvate transaminase